MYLRDVFGLCSKELDLQEFWISGFIKHGITGEVKADGSHGKEGGEIGYKW